MFAFLKKWFKKEPPPAVASGWSKDFELAPETEPTTLDALIEKNLSLGHEIDVLRVRRLELKTKIEALIHDRDSKKGA